MPKHFLSCLSKKIKLSVVFSFAYREFTIPTIINGFHTIFTGEIIFHFFFMESIIKIFFALDINVDSPDVKILLFKVIFHSEPLLRFNPFKESPKEFKACFYSSVIVIFPSATVIFNDFNQTAISSLDNGLEKCSLLILPTLDLNKGISVVLPTFFIITYCFLLYPKVFLSLLFFCFKLT